MPAAAFTLAAHSDMEAVVILLLLLLCSLVSSSSLIVICHLRTMRMKGADPVSHTANVQVGGEQDTVLAMLELNDAALLAAQGARVRTGTQASSQTEKTELPVIDDEMLASSGHKSE